MRNSQKKALLRGSASLCVIGMLLMPAAVQAQESTKSTSTAQSSSDKDDIETVVVSGIRKSLQSAQSIKQTSDQVVDSITATDIGALPDRNVAEALQRVPGVALERTDAPDDPTRYGSTGTSVYVRGLSWVKSLMNGRDEFSAVDGRTLSFADVSSDLLAGVDVFKNPTAKMIEGGVGGTINLKTRKPFDQSGAIFGVSADYTYGTLSDRALPSISVLASDRWKTKIGEMGLLLSVDWQDQITRTEGINLGAYDCWDMSSGAHYDANDDGYDSCMDLDVGEDGREMGPDGWAWRQMEFRQQRFATNLVFQWRPNEEWEITLSGLNTYAHKTDMEHYVYMITTSSTTDLGYMADANFDKKGKWLGGAADISSIDTRAGTGHNRNSDLNLHIDYTPNDSWQFSTDFQFVEASSPYRSVTMYTALNTTQEVDLDLTGSNPKISYSDDSGTMSDASNYQWNAAMDYMRYNVAHAETARADATHTWGGTGLMGYFKSVDIGVRTEQKLAVTRETAYNWGAICPTSWGGSYSGCPSLDGTVAESYTAADGSTVTSNSDAVNKVNSYAEYFSFAKIFGNSLPGFYLPKTSLVAMNTLKSYKILSSIEPEDAGDLQNYARWISYAEEAGCKGDDMTCLALYENTDGNNSASNRVSKQKQATYAGYFQVNFVHEDFFGLFALPFDGNFGLRVVRTENDISDGKLVMPTLNDTSCYVGKVIDEDKDISVDSCDDFNNAVTYLGGTENAGATVSRPSVSSSYTNFLPSFNFRAFLTDTLQARFAFSESIVRPDFSYTRNNATLTFNWGDSTSAEAFEFTSDPSGNGGNPNLKPMKAFNYDTSLEWYFAPTGSVTVSLFYKDLSNYIFSSTTTESITNPNSGDAMDFNYTTYVNGDHGKVQGFELAYQQFYDMLPSPFDGLGFQANYTKIYNSGGHNGAVDVSSDTAVANSNNRDLPLEGMSEDSYNLAVMYAKYGVDFRLAYNWRSGYLLASSGTNVNQPVWAEDYGQLDGSLFYTFLDHYKIGVQVTNILGTSVYTDVGYADFHPRVNWIDVDQKISVALRTNW